MLRSVIVLNSAEALASVKPIAIVRVRVWMDTRKRRTSKWKCGVECYGSRAERRRCVGLFDDVQRKRLRAERSIQHDEVSALTHVVHVGLDNVIALVQWTAHECLDDATCEVGDGHG